jgi:hypothetical protein
MLFLYDSWIEFLLCLLFKEILLNLYLSLAPILTNPYALTTFSNQNRCLKDIKIGQYAVEVRKRGNWNLLSMLHQIFYSLVWFKEIPLLKEKGTHLRERISTGKVVPSLKDSFNFYNWIKLKSKFHRKPLFLL